MGAEEIQKAGALNFDISMFKSGKFPIPKIFYSVFCMFVIFIINGNATEEIC